MSSNINRTLKGLLEICITVLLISNCKHGSNSSSSNNQSYVSSHAQPIKHPAKSTFAERYLKNKNYTSAELRGLQIWYKATAGTETFHHGPYIQRLGILPNWNDIFGLFRNDVTHQGKTNGSRRSRFDKWGIINDPDCRPATPEEDFFGWQVCPGDEELVKHLGSKTDGKGDTWFKNDPSCTALGDNNRPQQDELDLDFLEYWDREDACHLRFGTSAGAIGFRKFPNPKFDRKEWDKNGGWSGYYRYTQKNRKNRSKEANQRCWQGDEANCIPDGIDSSLQPPFIVGTTCAFCHTSFEPTNAPGDPNHPSPPRNPNNPQIAVDKNNPQWENINFLTGAQFARMSEIQAGHFRRNSLEWQGFAPSRAGTVDTSAVPADFVYNPGTPNRILNFNMRPELLFSFLRNNFNSLHPADKPLGKSPVINAIKTNIHGEPIYSQDKNDFTANVTRWERQKYPCKGSNCQTIKHKNYQAYWQRKTHSVQTPHILKGAEDDVGPALAVQRVYINIGSCSQQCWVNNLADIRAFSGRNKRQTPLNIAQCRRDCPSFRALEDRVVDIYQFLLTNRSADLKDALGKETDEEKLYKKATENITKFIQSTKGQPYRAELNKDPSQYIADGRDIFNRECSACHSTQGGYVNDARGQNIKTSIGRKYRGNSVEIANKRHYGKVSRDWLGNDKRVPNSREGLQINECRSLHSNHMRGHIWSEFSSNTYKNLLPVTTNKPLGALKTGGGRGYYRNVSLNNIWMSAPLLHNNSVGPELCNSLFPPQSKDQYGRTVPCVPPPVNTNSRLAVFESSMNQLLTPMSERIQKTQYTTKKIELPLSIDDVSPATLPAGLPVSLIASLDVKDLYDGLTKGADGNFFQKLKWIGNLSKILGSLAFNRKGYENLLIKYSNCSDTIENRGHTFGSDLNPLEKQKLISFMKTL